MTRKFKKIKVYGNITIDGKLKVGKKLKVKGDLSVNGQTTISGLLNITGSLESDGEVIINGASEFNGSVNVTGSLIVNSVSDLNGDTTIQSLNANDAIINSLSYAQPVSTLITSTIYTISDLSGTILNVSTEFNSITINLPTSITSGQFYTIIVSGYNISNHLTLTGSVSMFGIKVNSSGVSKINSSSSFTITDTAIGDIIYMTFISPTICHLRVQSTNP